MNKYRDLQRLQSLLFEFDRLQVTSMEYAYLKLLSIFNPGTDDGLSFTAFSRFIYYLSCFLACLRSNDQLDAYRMLSYKEFRDHINDRCLSSTSYDEYSGDSERLGRLLLKLPTLAEFETNIIEEIFFVGLIGMSEDFFVVQGNEGDLPFAFV